MTARWIGRRASVLALLAGLAAAAPAHAATQTTADPNDAYTLASGGESDIRSVEWLTAPGGSITLTVRVEMASSFVAFTWMDVDRNGRADYTVAMDGGSGSTTFDAELRAVPDSTVACQLYNGSVPVIDQQPTYT